MSLECLFLDNTVGRLQLSVLCQGSVTWATERGEVKLVFICKHIFETMLRDDQLSLGSTMSVCQSLCLCDLVQEGVYLIYAG